MSLVVFEPAVLASDWPQIHALDRVATQIGRCTHTDGQLSKRFRQL